MFPDPAQPPCPHPHDHSAIQQEQPISYRAKHINSVGPPRLSPGDGGIIELLSCGFNPRAPYLMPCASGIRSCIGQADISNPRVILSS
ncbi:hypothetical protein GN956_G12289 [Arapaima gigas]